MRTEFVECETRYMAKKLCTFTPNVIAKVVGGYMCFESQDDYRVWKNQK